ncbi:MAG: response regulator transcription factor [Candidatus Marinimicrobia bacterium]|nr:response regulator transcription factor [Candidatus Neomarinimicrobiota bacterium]
MIDVFIADDHEIVRKGLSTLINETWDMKLIGEGKNGHDVLSTLVKDNCDVLILDISMPGMNGLEVLKQIKMLKPNLPVLILSMHPENQYARRMLKAGAAGYLNKESASTELVKAIRKIYNGHKYITGNVAELLADDLMKGSKQSNHESLSDREFEIMQLIAKGKTVSQIADMLCLSVKTVSTHRHHILEKLQVENNAQIICYALRHDLVEMEL